MAGRRPSIRWQLALVAVATIAFFTNLGTPRLWDRDEPRNAGCAAEMLQRGDWVVPVFNAQLRTHKPVLLYWLMISAYTVFGTDEFAARFWSAALAVGTVLATFQIGRRLFDDEAGFWGALVLATTIMFAVVARAATPDSVLIFFMTLALAVYVFGTFPAGGAVGCNGAVGPSDRVRQWFPQRWSVVASMYALMGFAVLAKGPVGVVLPTAAIGMFVLVMGTSPAGREEDGQALPAWRRGLRAAGKVLGPRHVLSTCWRLRPLTAAVMVLAVAGPWYCWVGIRTDGVWLKQFFWIHNISRAAQPMEGHGGSVFYYVMALCVGFFPWSVFFGPVWIDTVRRIRRDHPWSPGLILLVCWAAVYIGIFSLARTKLPSYITPAYPAVALLTGGFVSHYRRHAACAPDTLLKLALVILATVGAGLLVLVPEVVHHYMRGAEWLGLVGLIPLIGGALAYRWHIHGAPRHAAAACAGAALVFVTALVALVPTVADGHRPLLGRLEAIAADADMPAMATWGCLEPSWVFYTRHPIRELAPDGATAAAAAFLTGDGRRLLITTANRYAKIEKHVPGDIRVLARLPAFLKAERLLLVTRSHAAHAATAAGATGSCVSLPNQAYSVECTSRCNR